jgi:hypothetical protein
MAGWTGAAVVAVVLVAAVVVWLARRRLDGRFRAAPANARPANARPTHDSPTDDRPADPEVAVLRSLGVAPGPGLTLVQFSSAFCAPCRATRVLCADAASRVPGVRHVEVDAESHLDAVRALGIWRTPTVLVVDGDGRVRRRASGAPTRDQLMRAIASTRSELASPAV